MKTKLRIFKAKLAPLHIFIYEPGHVNFVMDGKRAYICADHVPIDLRIGEGTTIHDNYDQL